ncbi:hypothetical protein VP01_182g1 [Puccinia sorghi]|uniref:Uncharacterized protein n=1 Tax=Puccinia sorghi TaxID=27349 RepID=A0A0L6VFQ9_9BASI|nr:hypothetical protein VP01_182g1 [Puccinia sorghi]
MYGLPIGERKTVSIGEYLSQSPIKNTPLLPLFAHCNPERDCECSAFCLPHSIPQNSRFSPQLGLSLLRLTPVSTWFLRPPAQPLDPLGAPPARLAPCSALRNNSRPPDLPPKPTRAPETKPPSNSLPALSLFPREACLFRLTKAKVNPLSLTKSPEDAFLCLLWSASAFCVYHEFHRNPEYFFTLASIPTSEHCKQNLLNCLQLTFGMLQPSCHPNSICLHVKSQSSFGNGKVRSKHNTQVVDIFILPCGQGGIVTDQKKTIYTLIFVCIDLRIAAITPLNGPHDIKCDSHLFVAPVTPQITSHVKPRIFFFLSCFSNSTKPIITYDLQYMININVMNMELSDDASKIRETLAHIGTKYIHIEQENHRFLPRNKTGKVFFVRQDWVSDGNMISLGLMS